MKNTIAKMMVVGALMVGGSVMAAEAPAQPAKPAHATKAPAKPAATDTKDTTAPAPAHTAAKGTKHHKG